MSTPDIHTLEATLFAASRQQFEQLIQTLISPESQRLDHGAIEAILQTDGTEVLRSLMQGYLDTRAQQEAPQTNVVGADGIVRPHRRKQLQRQLTTLFGDVSVTRNGYSTKEAGVSALYPEDGKLNLPTDQYSDGVRQRVAIEASKVSFGETSRTLAQTTGAEVGKRQCEEIIVKVAQDFEAFYAQRSRELPEASSDLVVMTSDGKGIVMHTEDLRPATALKAAQKAKEPAKTRLSPGEKRQRKRMATVGAVYSVPRYVRQPKEIMGEKRDPPPRPQITNKRVWASVREDAKTVIGSVFAEAQKRDPLHLRDWVMLVDGEVHQLDIIEALTQSLKQEVTIVLDFIHVLEYLWKAALCFFVSGSPEAEEWVRERALRLLEGRVSDVAAGIRRSATLQKLSAKDREHVDKCADYLLKYRNFLHYDQYLAQGYPIASGVIEGACRHLIADRMDITGARWRLDRAEAVLQIRALRASGDFKEYWTFHKLQEFKRLHVSKFQNPKRLLQV